MTKVAKASESQALLDDLRQGGPARDAAIVDLHGLLLRGAHFELGRRHAALAHISRSELEDLAMQAANDALAAILAKLDTFRGRAASPPGPTSSCCSRRA